MIQLIFSHIKLLCLALTGFISIAVALATGHAHRELGMSLPADFSRVYRGVE